MTKAFAYMRTSSNTNVGEDKDSDKRQAHAIQSYADAHGIEIVAWFYDAGVKGSEAVHTRPGFADMLAAIAGNGVRMVLVETANRFARELMVQETGYAFLHGLGISLVPVDAPDCFTDDGDPMKKAIRQILGAISELDKAMTVAKLKAARDRKRLKTGRCEGPKQAPEAHRMLANTLSARGLSLRAIAAELASAGCLAPSQKVYGAESIKRMLTP